MTVRVYAPDGAVGVECPRLRPARAAGLPGRGVHHNEIRVLTRKLAASFDLPDARVVVVPHPLGGTDEATILARADAAVDDGIAHLH